MGDYTDFRQRVYQGRGESLRETGSSGWPLTITTLAQLAAGGGGYVGITNT
jgi:hypothetical protein